jgi:hypothetical protein
MRTKNRGDPPTLFALSNPDLCTSNAFSNVPITPKESSGSSIQRIPHHTALFYGPFRQYCKSPAEYAAVIEFTVWEDMLCLLAYSIEVLLRPAFLESDNVWRRVGRSDFRAYLGEALSAVGGEVFETPAIVGEHLKLRRRVHQRGAHRVRLKRES